MSTRVHAIGKWDESQSDSHYTQTRYAQDKYRQKIKMNCYNTYASRILLLVVAETFNSTVTGGWRARSKSTWSEYQNN